jgi:PAS domain S-box-containing protein
VTEQPLQQSNLDLQNKLDTDQRTSAQAELFKSEQVFKLLVGSVKEYAIFLLDSSGLVMTWNEGAERIKGYKADEIIGQHFSKFYMEDARRTKHPDYELRKAIEEGSYQEEGWRVRKDGTTFWASVTITAVYDRGELIGFAKVTRDLTERRAAEQREEVFRMLVGGIRDYAIFMLSPDGNVLTWNEGAERITGYEAGDIIGKHFSCFYSREAQKRKHPERELGLARLTGRYEEEGWRIRKDGTLLWASVVITAIHDNNQLIGFAKITRDLTQRLLADQEREASAKMLDQTNEELKEALEVKSRFLSTISHEVRTPMAGIIGMTEVLALEDLGEDNNVVVQNIFESSKRLLRLLNNLLEAARMESGDLHLENRDFPIRTVLGDVRQIVNREASAKNLQLEGSCDPLIPETVYGDELKIRQVLLNLVHNAVKFTHNGEVSVNARVVDRSSNYLTIRFSVKDTGIGIKQEDSQKLFQPFSQAQESTKRLYGGSGLGLSISKQLVESMGGTMGFESIFGEGSLFWVDLPFPAGCSS